MKTKNIKNIYVNIKLKHKFDVASMTVYSIKELFKLTSSNVQIVYLDVDEVEDLSNFLRIRKLPTFISFVGKDKMDIF